MLAHRSENQTVETTDIDLFIRKGEVPNKKKVGHLLGREEKERDCENSKPG